MAVASLPRWLSKVSTFLTHLATPEDMVRVASTLRAEEKKAARAANRMASEISPSRPCNSIKGGNCAIDLMLDDSGQALRGKQNDRPVAAARSLGLNRCKRVWDKDKKDPWLLSMTSVCPNVLLFNDRRTIQWYNNSSSHCLHVSQLDQLITIHIWRAVRLEAA